MRRFAVRTALRAPAAVSCQIRHSTKSPRTPPDAWCSATCPTASTVGALGSRPTEALRSRYDSLPEDAKDDIRSDISSIRSGFRRSPSSGVLAPDVPIGHYCAGPVLIGTCRDRQHWLQYDTAVQRFTLSWGDDAAKLQSAVSGPLARVLDAINHGASPAFPAAAASGVHSILNTLSECGEAERLPDFGRVAEHPVLIGTRRDRQHWLQYDAAEQLFTLSWGNDPDNLAPAFRGEHQAVGLFIKDGIPAAAALIGAGTQPHHQPGSLLERLGPTDSQRIDHKSPVSQVLVTAGKNIWCFKGLLTGTSGIPNMVVGAIGGGGKTALHSHLAAFCDRFNQAKKDGRYCPAECPQSLWESFDRFVAPIATFNQGSEHCYDTELDTEVNIIHRTARRLLLSLHPPTSSCYNDRRFSWVGADLVEAARAIQGHMAAQHRVASERVGVILFIDELMKIPAAARRRLLDALAAAQQSCVCELGLGVFPVVSSLELEPVAEEWVTASKRQMAVIHLPPLSVEQLAARLVRLVKTWDMAEDTRDQCIQQVKVIASLSGGHPRSAQELLDNMTGTPDCGKPKPIQGTGWANRSKDCDFFKVMEAFHDNVSPAGIDKTLLKEVCDNHIVQRVYAPAVNNLSIDVRLIPWRALTLLPEGRFWVSVFESLFTVTVPERTLLWERTMPVLLLLAAQIKKQTASAYLKTIGVEVHPDSPLSKIRKIDDTVFARVKRMTFGGEQPQLTEEVVRVLSDSMPQSEACDTVMLIDTTDKAQRSIDGVLVGSSNGRDLGVCISTKVKLSKEGGPVDPTTVTNRERCSKDMAKLMKVHQQGIMEDFVQAGSAISPSLRAEPGNETTTVLSHFLLFSTGPVAKEHVNTASLTVVPEAACLRIARCFGFETSLAQVIGDK